MRRSRRSRRGGGRATRGSAMRSTTSAWRSCAWGGSRTVRECSTRSASSTPKNPELAALRDKANVALGYAWLQASHPVEAKPSLERVRLTGPFSNKALLGVGWSDAETKNYAARSRRGSSCATATCSTRPCRSRCSRCPMRSRSSAPRSRRRITTWTPSKRSAPRSTGSRRRSTRSSTANSITELLGEHPDDGRRRLRLVLAPRQGARHGREPLPLRAHGEQRIQEGAQELSRLAVPQPQPRPLGREPQRVRRHSRYASARVRAAPAGDRPKVSGASISTR